MKDENKALEARIITLGDSKVGKSSLIVQFIDNKFSFNYMSTVGFDLKRKVMKFNDNEEIKIVLHDTAGQERFRSLTTNYIKKANGILLVYDITDRKSFDNIKNWMDNIHEETGDKLPIILVGNKIDLNKERAVLKNEGEEKAKEFGLRFYETSAKEGNNVQECFRELVELIVEKIHKRSLSTSNSKNKKLNKSNNIKKKNECCKG